MLAKVIVLVGLLQPGLLLTPKGTPDTPTNSVHDESWIKAESHSLLENIVDYAASQRFQVSTFRT